MVMNPNINEHLKLWIHQKFRQMFEQDVLKEVIHRRMFIEAFIEFFNVKSSSKLSSCLRQDPEEWPDFQNLTLTNYWMTSIVLGSMLIIAGFIHLAETWKHILRKEKNRKTRKQMRDRMLTRRGHHNENVLRFIQQRLMFNNE